MPALKPVFAKVMPFAGYLKQEAEEKGFRVLNTTVPFDQERVLLVRARMTMCTCTAS